MITNAHISNRVIPKGETVLDTQYVGRWKVGDGRRPYNELPFQPSLSGPSGEQGKRGGRGPSASYPATTNLLKGDGAGGAADSGLTAAAVSSALGAVSDVAYDATTWDGDTTHAPSKNAVRDKFESLSTLQTLSGAGAVDVVTSATAFTSTGSAQALTLANGVAGQIKTIAHVVDGGSGVLTPTTKSGYSTITFTNVGDSVTLQFHTTAGWCIIGSYGVTIA